MVERWMGRPIFRVSCMRGRCRSRQVKRKAGYNTRDKGVMVQRKKLNTGMNCISNALGIATGRQVIEETTIPKLTWFRSQFWFPKTTWSTKSGRQFCCRQKKRAKDQNVPECTKYRPGIMYVNDLSADSTWLTELEFLVTNSSYIPTNFVGWDKAAEMCFWGRFSDSIIAAQVWTLESFDKISSPCQGWGLGAVKEGKEVELASLCPSIGGHVIRYISAEVESNQTNLLFVIYTSL